MSTCTGLSVSGADFENCNGEYHLVDDQAPWAPDMARKERRDSPSPSGPIGGFYGATVWRVASLDGFHSSVGISLGGEMYILTRVVSCFLPS